MRLVTLAAFLLLPGCVTPIQEGPRATLKEVGVVSILGPQIHGEFVGSVSMDQRNFSQPAPELAVDDTAEAMLEAQLATRFTRVVRLEAAYPLSGVTFRERFDTMVFGDDAKRFAPLAMKLAAAHRLDAVVVLYPCGYKLDSEPFVEGYGLLTRPYIGARASQAFLAARLAVYDGKTGAVLAANKGELFARTLTDWSWRERFSEYTPNEQAQLKETLHELLRSGIPPMLRQLGMDR